MGADHKALPRQPGRDEDDRDDDHNDDEARIYFKRRDLPSLHINCPSTMESDTSGHVCNQVAFPPIYIVFCFFFVHFTLHYSFIVKYYLK